MYMYMAHTVVMSPVDNRDSVYTVFLDFVKAFDKVPR